MATNTPLIDLVKDLLQAAEHITSYLQAKNLPQPSLAVGGHDLPPAPEIAAARRTLQEASKTLSQLAVPRTEHLRYVVCGVGVIVDLDDCSLTLNDLVQRLSCISTYFALQAL